jgi:hypothetical protein
LIHIWRVRTNNPNFKKGDAAFLTSAHQAAELVDHRIIVEDTIEVNDDGNITTHWFRKV